MGRLKISISLNKECLCEVCTVGRRVHDVQDCPFARCEETILFQATLVATSLEFRRTELKQIIAEVRVRVGRACHATTLGRRDEPWLISVSNGGSAPTSPGTGDAGTRLRRLRP